MVELVISYGWHIDNNFKCLFMRYEKHDDVKSSRRGWIEGMRALLNKIEKEL